MPSLCYLCLLLNCFFLQYGVSRQIQQDCSRVLCLPCSQRQQQVQSPQNECCHPCPPHCICPNYLQQDCEQEGFKDLIIPIGKSIYKDYGTQKCTCVSHQNIVCTSTCPKIPPTCKYIGRPLDGCAMCACRAENDDDFVPAGETIETECSVCKCPPEGGELQCTQISKGSKC